MLDERRFLPEIARLLSIWRQHGGEPATEDVLCHWARTTAAWTRTIPNPRQALIGLQTLGLVDMNDDGECLLSDTLRQVIDHIDDDRDDLEGISEHLGIHILYKMLESEQFRVPFDETLTFCRTVNGALVADWRNVPITDQRNVAWIWLQQLGLAHHLGNAIVLSPSLRPFVMDDTIRSGPLTQAELDIRLLAQRQRALLAEEYVVQLEKERLQSIGLPEYAEGVIRISDDDVSAGFDILSFDRTGERRYIEVKSSSGPRQWFIWSRNEFDVSQERGDAYWLAWVGWAVRLPDGPCEVAWFQNPAAVLQNKDSPWKAAYQDCRITRITDDSKFSS